MTANGESRAVAGPGATRCSSTSATPQGVLELEVGDGVECHATAFTPGLA